MTDMKIRLEHLRAEIHYALFTHEYGEVNFLDLKNILNCLIHSFHCIFYTSFGSHNHSQEF